MVGAALARNARLLIHMSHSKRNAVRRNRINSDKNVVRRNAGPVSIPRIATNQPSETCSSDQTVIFGVTSDPVPHDSTVLHDGESAISETDANRIDVVLAFQFFEL